MQLSEIQKRLSEIACPLCKKSEFFILPQAQKSFAEDIHKARCACGYTFQVSIPTRPVGQADPDLGQWLAGLNCPACRQNGVELNFRCMPSVRECVYFVSCKSCRQPFREQAPMEAFE